MSSTADAPRTLVQKIWDDHVVHQEPAAPTVLGIDLQLIHEVTSPQAFEGLLMTGRTVRAPEKTIAVPDHNVPTTAGRENPDQMPEEIDFVLNFCLHILRSFGFSEFNAYLSTRPGDHAAGDPRVAADDHRTGRQPGPEGGSPAGHGDARLCGRIYLQGRGRDTRHTGWHRDEQAGRRPRKTGMPIG